MKKIVGTEKIVVGPAVASFPNLFQPNDKSGKYEIDLIYEKGSDTHKMIAKIEKQAIEERWGSSPPKGLLRAVQDGDKRLDREGEVRPGYAGKLFTKARSKREPFVTDATNQRITDPMVLKGGDIVGASISAYPYVNQEWNTEGVYINLYAAKKLRDGEPLGGGGGANGPDGALEVFEPDLGEDYDISF